MNCRHKNPLVPLSLFRQPGESTPFFCYLLMSLMCLTFAGSPLFAATDDPAPKQDRLRILHVSGHDSGGVPAELKKFSNYLRRAGANHWKLQEEKAVRLKGTKPLEVALPGKLGKAIISVDAKKVATVRFLDPKGKSLGKYRSSRFPLVIVNQRLKLKGQPYVFILDLPRKK